MRIGIDASILGPETRYSGIGRYVDGLVRALADTSGDHRIELFAPEGTDLPMTTSDGVGIHMLPVPHLGKLSLLASYMWRLPQLARDLGLDVVHAPTVHPRPAWPPVPRRLTCPLVVTLHDVIPMTLYGKGPRRLPLRQRAWYRWNLGAVRRAARVITVSRASRAEISGLLALPADRLDVVCNGVVQTPIGERRDQVTPYVLFVGSFESRKNLITVLQAFARVASAAPGLALVVVAAAGSGDAIPIHEEIRRSGLHGRVRIVSGLTDGDLALLYRNATVFVFPSLAEGFGLPPLEAMAAGTPVIASDLAAHREILGDAARLVAPLDDAALAAAILDIVTSPGEQRMMSVAGWARASRYTWAETARQTLDVYRAATGRAPATDQSLDEARTAAGVPR